jgi:hypothetical protein
VNSAEDIRANFRKGIDGKPLFSTLFGIHTAKLNELKTVLKVNTRAGRSGVVNKTSLESMAQDDLQEVKIRSRHISNHTSQTEMTMTEK